MNHAAITYVDVTIADGAATSSAANLSAGQTLVGLLFAAGVDNTAMTFTASDSEGGTYVAVYDVGGASAYSITVGASRYVPVKVDVFSGVRFLKCVGGGNETGAQTVRLVIRNV